MSGTSITIEVQDTELNAALARLHNRAADLSPLMRQIGEALTESTLRRFGTSTAPDGSRWAPNAQSTYVRYLGLKSKTTGKDGRLNAKGIGLAINKKPLIGHSRMLSTQIHYQLVPNGVAIGSNQIYSAVQQFGAAQGAFGRTKRGAPIPWGRIPARPFLGVSDADRVTIRSLVANYFAPGA